MYNLHSGRLHEHADLVASQRPVAVEVAVLCSRSVFEIS